MGNFFSSYLYDTLCSQKRLMVSMVLCASAIILFAFQVYKVNIRSEHYFDTGYTNNQVKMLLKDKNEKNIDEERKIAYINSKYNATFNEEAATAEKEKIINEISAVELEHLMPDNYSIRYIITYLYLKNFILLVGFLIITMGLTVQLYKHCFRVGITEHYLLFVAVSTISLKQVCYILSNFGYSSGANMNLWLITNNPVMRMIDILALAIIGGYLIKGIFQNTKHNKN